MKISFAAVYNASLIVGIILIGIGTWQFSHGAAGIVVGALILAFTLYGAQRLTRRSDG